jgi:hypothetical protein
VLPAGKETCREGKMKQRIERIVSERKGYYFIYILNDNSNISNVESIF